MDGLYVNQLARFHVVCTPLVISIFTAAVGWTGFVGIPHYPHRQTSFYEQTKPSLIWVSDIRFIQLTVPD